jgi:hypothetical protein
MQGIVVGCDQNQEWLLPWWWKHYSEHNSYPVAFVDFGMSEKAVAWVSERGQYIKLPATAPLKEISPELLAEWNSTSEQRAAWFKKPFACLHSPSPMSIWIDLDCEIRGGLEPLFNILAFGDLALVQTLTERLLRKQTSLLPEYTIYNSGVMPFRRDACIISRWVEETMHRSGDFLGDQDLLSWLIHTHRPTFIELSAIYNWHVGLGANPEAVMVHYAGDYKGEIAEKLGSIEQ